MSDTAPPHGGRQLVSEHLPPQARLRLVRAAQTPIPDDDPLARVRAVNEASLFARLQNPELFKKEDAS